VLCEKPPTVDAAEMQTVAEAAADGGLTYMFARQMRFGPHLREARELVLEGALGEVYHAESRWMRGRNIPFRGGWGVNKDHGGGVLLDLGVHQIDDAWFAMGCPQPVSVFAAMHSGMSHLAPDDLSMPYNADDATVGLIRFANGATLNFTVTFALNIDWHEGYFDLNKARGRPNWRELRVYGDQAGLDVSKAKIVEGDVTGISARSYQPREAFTQHSNVFVAQMSEFARAIREGDEPLSSASQAVALMQMLDAVKRSAETGTSVEITRDVV
jgi:predicted dehydrogenase